MLHLEDSDAETDRPASVKDQTCISNGCNPRSSPLGLVHHPPEGPHGFLHVPAFQTGLVIGAVASGGDPLPEILVPGGDQLLLGDVSQHCSGADVTLDEVRVVEARLGEVRVPCLRVELDGLFAESIDVLPGGNLGDARGVVHVLE